jgi:hypothetical protein
VLSIRILWCGDINDCMFYTFAIVRKVSYLLFLEMIVLLKEIGVIFDGDFYKVSYRP